MCRLLSGPVPPHVTVPQVLKILLHLCGHGSSSSLLILKRNPAFIQEAAGTGRRGESSQRPSDDRQRCPPAAPVFSPAPHTPATTSWPSLRPPHGAEWPGSACVPCQALAARTRPACSSGGHTTGAQQASAPPPASRARPPPQGCSLGPETGTTVGFCFRRSVGDHQERWGPGLSASDAMSHPTPTQARACHTSFSLARTCGDMA